VPAISFSGLGSGLDTASLVSQLVSVEKQPATLLQTQQSNLSSQKGIIDSIASSVSAFGDLANSMKLSSDVNFRTATTSDSHVTVAVSSAAVATTHAVRVEQLAKAQVVTSRPLASAAAGVLGAGSVKLNGTSTISWSSTDSLNQIASKINDAKAGVSASVLFDGTSYHLVMSSQKTGTASATTFQDAGDGLDFANPDNIRVKAKDCKIMLDGIEVTRPTNVIDDALTGVTITAAKVQAAEDPDTDVSVSFDNSAAQAKVQKFVDGFNKIAGAISGQLTYTGTTKGANTLFGDSTLAQLQRSMQNIVTQKFGGKTLLDLGVSIDKTGVMSIDDTKFDAAMAANPNILAETFAAGGLSTAVSGLTETYTRSGDGILSSKSSALSHHKDDLQKQIDQINTNADSLQTRLEAQFNALEQIMSKFQSQASYVSKILAA